MVLTFSIWLRETGRLYLRYLTLALASVPFAAGVAWAERGGWNEPAALEVFLTLSVSVIAALLIWNRLGPWQAEAEVAVSSFDAQWADLLKAAGPPVRQLSRSGGVTGGGLTQTPAPVFLEGTTQASDDVLQQLMRGKRRPWEQEQFMGRKDASILSQAISIESSPTGAQPLLDALH